ncbi:MAG TPA: NAD-dependent epimerase/dehydratase family protein [Vicinamibacterales bacterium]
MLNLVTGGTGFTGSHLVRRLLQRGQQVRVLDREPGLFSDELRRLGAEITLGSVTDPAVVDRLTAGVRRVYHIAAVFRRVNLPAKVYHDVNVVGTRIVAEAALRHGVESFVYCSTQGVHGHIASPPGDEDSPIKPEDYYQETKYLGEQEVVRLVAQGLPATILRPTAIYGPGDPGRFLYLFRAARRGRFLMFGDGTTLYHPVYIDNLVDAFELAGARQGRGEAYIIADEHYYSLNELVTAVGKSLGVDVRIVHLPFTPLLAASVVCEAVCRPLGLEPPLFRRRADWFRQIRAFRIDRARRDLGYAPRVDLPTGLALTAQWYKEHGYLQ